MKVIVKVSGFFGGNWHDAKADPQEMADAVAKQFLPPHGDQLALPAARAAAAPAQRTATEKRRGR